MSLDNAQTLLNQAQAILDVIPNVNDPTDPELSTIVKLDEGLSGFASDIAKYSEYDYFPADLADNVTAIQSGCTSLAKLGA